MVLLSDYFQVCLEALISCSLSYLKWWDWSSPNSEKESEQHRSRKHHLPWIYTAYFSSGLVQYRSSFLQCTLDESLFPVGAAHITTDAHLHIACNDADICICVLKSMREQRPASIQCMIHIRCMSLWCVFGHYRIYFWFVGLSDFF